MKFDASTRADAFDSLVSVKDLDETYFAENYRFKA
jgi:hypothetical protein